MSAENDPAIDCLALHYAFAETQYGQAMDANVRFGPYKPEDVSNQRWVELLGPDVNNLSHLPDTYLLTQGFIRHTKRLRPGELSEQDKIILPIAAISHDWHEGIPSIGDVNYNDRTDLHEAEERQTFIDNVSNFYTGGSIEIEELIVRAAKEVIFNKTSRLGRMFNAVERIGYLRTAVRAAEHVHDVTAPDCMDGLVWLAADTLSNHHTTHLIAAGHRFPAAHHFLKIYEQSITRAFEVVYPDATFARNDPKRAAAKEYSLKTARDVWGSWCGVYDARA